jgi:hypothetical protein
MFPGDQSMILNELNRSKFDKSDYCTFGNTISGQGGFAQEFVQVFLKDSSNYPKYTNYGGVWFSVPNTSNIPQRSLPCNWPFVESESEYIQLNSSLNKSFKIQTLNQYIYFRILDIHTNDYLYSWGANVINDGSNSYIKWEYLKDNQLSMGYSIGTEDGYLVNNFNVMTSIPGNAITFNESRPEDMWIYPKLTDQYGLCINSNLNYLQINPKDKLIIPIAIEFSNPQNKPNKCFKKTISFDIWPSLYKDPVNYSFTINAKYENSTQDKLVSQQQADYNGTESKYNIIYK